MANEFELTPAQTEFLTSTIDGFSAETWVVGESMKSGSDRSFVRLHKRRSPQQSYVLIVWDSGDNDWQRFLDIARCASRHCDILPEVYAFDPMHGLILEEDLGNVRLYTRVSEAPHKNDVIEAYQQTIDALLHWHGLEKEFCMAASEREMDFEMFLWESEYFATHCVTEFFGLEKLLTSEWDKERSELARRTASIEQVVIHRDFQSENIMLCDGRVRFVDFQGARLGPAEYDLASLLYDPYVSVLDDSLVECLAQYYASQANAPLNVASFRDASVQRLLQALGAYANLSIHKGKVRYRDYVPVALSRLSSVLRVHNAYPTIARVVNSCLEAL